MNTDIIVPDKTIKVAFALFISILISGCNSEETTQTDKMNKDTNIASPIIEGNDINEQNNNQESQNKEKMRLIYLTITPLWCTCLNGAGKTSLKSVPI